MDALASLYLGISFCYGAFQPLSCTDSPSHSTTQRADGAVDGISQRPSSRHPPLIPAPRPSRDLLSAHQWHHIPPFTLRLGGRLARELHRGSSRHSRILLRRLVLLSWRTQRPPLIFVCLVVEVLFSLRRVQLPLGMCPWNFRSSSSPVYNSHIEEIHHVTLILDGKALSLRIRHEIHTQLQSFSSSPHLVVFLTHPNLASSIYVRNKRTACKEVGIRSTIIEHPCTTTEQVLQLLDPWNSNPDVDGILVQFPLHPNVSQRTVMEHISPSKDVDGVHPTNLGKLVTGDPTGFVPCTPLGIQTMLTHYGISPKGKHVVIVGRSVTVGKPLALLLSLTGPAADATVTIANRSTRDLSSLCQTADILIAAAGSPGLITPSMIKEGAVVIDVGINRIQTDEKIRLVGDVNFDQVRDRCSAITPVPGGVGPMTIASLLHNTVQSFVSQHA